MTHVAKLAFTGRLLAIMTAGCWLLSFPTATNAQSQGNDAVYNSSAICSSPTSCGFSGAFIDASVFAPNGVNFCNILNGILSSKTYPANGAVIDARGLNSNNTSMQCSASPWAGITSPSTILLPAGTILIPKSWILPANTRLIGEGDNPSASSFSAGTTIQACNSNKNSCTFSDSAMIQFGSSSAPGISMEKITLDGQGQVINGIVNSNSGSLTYVDRITLFQILGVGLLLQSNASYSGPYTNITFDTGSYAGLSQTTCAQLYNVTRGTHGIHGLTCISRTADATNAVLLDSSNNSLEDVAIAGFYSGIVLGSQASARSNVLINISDSTKACNPTCPPAPVNMIHVEPNTTNGNPT